MTSEFYDVNSPLPSTSIKDRSDFDAETDIDLCNDCEKTILQRYQDSNIICARFGLIYNPNLELV
jgi:hypothetical protein